MNTSQLIGCVINCLFSNGGGAGGAAGIDAAAQVAQNDPASLSRAERKKLLSTKLVYFYASNENAFGVNRDDLWRCISQCLGSTEPTPPNWFIAKATINTVIV